jgi:Flp pilus assembly secretin CpaC
MSCRALARRIGSRLGAVLKGIAIAVVLPSGGLAAQELIVKYDQSQLLRLPRPVAEIIIGNPSIADVTVQSGNLLVVTGKTFGITNVIALDKDRNVIQDQRVIVMREEARVINLQKGAKRESYNCTPNCNPSLVVGDDKAYFDAVSGMSNNKIKFSDSAADGAGGAPANQ